MPATEQKIARAQALRETALNHFKIIETSAQRAIQDESLHNRFKVGYRNLKKVIKDFEKHHNNLITLIASDGDELARENETCDDFTRRCNEVETIYYEVFESPLESKHDQSILPSANNALLIPNEHLHLPKLKLKTFSGDMAEFPSFHQMFVSAVHANRSLNNTDKFNFLISVLSGAALELIEDIPVVPDNYHIAYNIVLERYNNKREQAFSHWQKIESFAALPYEDANSLRNLLLTFKKNLSVLTTMGLETDKWDFILSYMLLNRLDAQTRKSFEQQHASNDIPKYEDLKSFIEKQCVALDAAASCSSKSIITSKNINKSQFSNTVRKNKDNFQTASKKSTFFVNAQENNVCFLCNANHIIFHCPTFKSKNPAQRFDIIKQKKACINCLATSHTINKCSSTKRCRICQKMHHSLLHFEDKKCNSIPASSSLISDVSPIIKEETEQSSKVGMLINADHEILLSTVLVKIRDCFNSWHIARAVLDCGAQSSFITRTLANKLGFKKFNISMSLQGLGEMYSSAKSGITCTIASLTQPDYCCTLDMIVLDKIADEIPSNSFSIEDITFIENLKLSDPNFNIKSKIDLLLGNDIYPYILQEGKINLGNNKPVCLNTVFGWTVMGKLLHSTSDTKLSKINSFFATSSNTTLDNTLQKFWSLEEVPTLKTVSPETTFCENYFNKTTSRSTDGKYIVALPFKSTNPDFGNTREIALRRFMSLEKRLSQNKEMYLAYSNVIRDYLDSNHMTLVHEPLLNEIYNYFYIPHHAVVKKESATTPVRVVFDASSHVINKPCLNQVLYVGPKLQNDLVKLLINFRLHKYVFTCDIKQMYRMIWLTEEHRQFQRILWRFSASEPICDYELNTVTFGITCSPYLAIRTLMQLANDYSEFPLASEILKHSVYIDDILGGSNSLATALDTKNQIINLLKHGGFEARKWASNSSELLEDVPDTHKQNFNISLDLENNNVLKILGLQWNPNKDVFFYSINCAVRNCTKRNILSDLARIFDPLGFLTPVTFFAKLMIQHLWTLGLAWDEEPPSDLLHKWEKFRTQLKLLENIEICREIITFDAVHYDLIGFCDASMKGYCGVVYLRITSKKAAINTYLVCAKSKVAPLKQITIPRLELCAAVLLAKLMEFVLQNFEGKIQFRKMFAFTDSSVALHWIRSSPHNWQTFVSNRVSYVQERLSPSVWYHIPSELNPADCGSRGLLPHELINHYLWWTGPDLLRRPSSTWNLNRPILAKSTDLDNEKRKIVLTVNVRKNFIDELLEKFSSFSKIKRILAFVLRAIHNFKNFKSRNCSSLSHLELHNSVISAVLHIQSSYFEQQKELIKNKKPLPKYFASLNPFIDEKGLLRVGGRLSYAKLSYDKRFPILLPNNSKLTTLLIYDIHVTYLHCGVQTTHFLLSQHFWIISAKKLIRKVLSKCFDCWKTNPKSLQPPLGNLPKFRISEAKAFSNVGTDFCGPFSITMSRLRGAKTLKSYVCLFICCATKAVHLELVSDMSTEGFLAALRRFIARRGRCTNIYSDCGTNFIGGAAYLRDLFRECAQSESISWHFNPPHAPHMGGLWEANIKSFKTHLNRVVGNQILTYEELNTVIVQIESVLNSRPLCAMSADPNDLSVLTPGHFLTLEPLTAVPDPDTTQIQSNRLTRWQLLQRLHRDFWQRWSQEYLQTLHQRFKWTKPLESIEPDTMVVIKNDNTNPLDWVLGRVIELIPGADKIPRVAVIKTAKGFLKRPLVKLCPLPINDN